MLATLTLDAAADRVWDAVVVGAGPAGAIAAKGLAERGASVLLVESKSFPRSKVCGGCLNRNSLSTLAAAGVWEKIDALGPVALGEFRLAAGGRSASLRLPGGAAVSRWAMDAALVEGARESGAEFLPETTAMIGEVAGEVRMVQLESHGAVRDAKARVVVAASGLGGRSLSQLDGFRSEESPDSRIGIEATLNDFPAEYEPGIIFMAVGRGGYVGLTRVEDGRLNVAAAVDASAVRDASGPGAACMRILEEAGFPVAEDMRDAEWRGTMKLTRRTSRRAGERLFLIGDAAGYIEPFTGEGMAWALASGSGVVAFAEESISGWRTELADDWERRYTRLIQKRQWLCRILAKGLRRTGLVRTLVPVLARMPWLAQPIVARLNRESDDSPTEHAAGQFSSAPRGESSHSSP